MTSILNKFKSLAIGVIVISFFVGVTLNSCTSNKKTDNTEATAESEEHPEGEEHPAAEAEGEEHPAGEEHPGDSTKEEHPTTEEK
jgi:hypothetical protein